MKSGRKKKKDKEKERGERDGEEGDKGDGKRRGKEWKGIENEKKHTENGMLNKEKEEEEERGLEGRKKRV